MANIGQGGSSLYKVLDAVERIKDSVESAAAERDAAITKKSAELEAQTREIGEQNATLKTEVEALRTDRDAAKIESDDKIAEIEARCQKLDKMLPVGEKVYTSGSRTKDENLALFGKAFTVARHAKNGGQLPADYARAQSEGTTTVTNTTTGGTLVPIETYNAAIRIIGEKSVGRQIARVVPMTSSTMIVPLVDSNPTVGWESEGANSETAVAFANDADSTLRAKTLTAYDSISRELDEDSLVALEPFFAEVFGDAIAKEENNQLLLGSGSPFTGITDAANTKDITNTANGFDVAYDDLVKLMFGVDGDVVNNGTFVMSMAFLGQVVGIKATTTGAPLFASAWGNGGLAGPGSNMPDAPQGLAGYIMGRPVYVSNTLPTVSGDVGQCLAVYGDFGHAIFGDRRSLSIEIDDSVFFSSRQRCLLAYERVGILIHGTAANPTFARLNEIA